MRDGKEDSQELGGTWLTRGAVAPISFSSKSEDHRYLSNFADTPFVLDGFAWKTVEHYFQAQKFSGTPLFEAILGAPTPQVAKRLGRSRDYSISSVDWDNRRESVMRQALLAKFTQNPQLRAQLVATGDALLIEDRNDPFWGRGKDGNGVNRLGVLLMELRRILRTDPAIVSSGELAKEFMSDKLSASIPLPGVGRRVRFPAKFQFAGRSTENLPHYFVGVLHPIVRRLLASGGQKTWRHVRSVLKKILSESLRHLEGCRIEDSSRTGPDHGFIRGHLGAERISVFYKFGKLNAGMGVITKFSLTIQSQSAGLFCALIANSCDGDPRPVHLVVRSGKERLDICWSRSNYLDGNLEFEATTYPSNSPASTSADQQRGLARFIGLLEKGGLSAHTPE